MGTTDVLLLVRPINEDLGIPVDVSREKNRFSLCHFLKLHNLNSYINRMHEYTVKPLG